MTEILSAALISVLYLHWINGYVCDASRYTATVTPHRSPSSHTLPQHTLSRFFCSSTHYGRPPHSVSVNQVSVHAGDRYTHKPTHILTLCVSWCGPCCELNAIFKCYLPPVLICHIPEAEPWFLRLHWKDGSHSDYLVSRECDIVISDVCPKSGPRDE